MQPTRQQLVREEVKQGLDPTATSESLRENIVMDLPEAIANLESLRNGSKTRLPKDVSFAEFVQGRWGISPDSKGGFSPLLEILGFSAGETNIHQLLTTAEFDSNYRWLVPEIIRDAIRQGMRNNGIYRNLILTEETIGQPRMSMPEIRPSSVMPKKLNEAESIPLGTVSFGQRDIKLRKVGIGIQLTDEVVQYCPLNLLSIQLSDVGMKLNTALDAEAIDVLVNGDQADGSLSAPEIGVENTTNKIQYVDMLRAWIRMGMLGKNIVGFLGDETEVNRMMNVAEFKALPGAARLVNLEIRTPIPATQAVWAHGAVPAGKIILVDPANTMIKLNAAPMRVESDRIASKQLDEVYVSMTTGFVNVFRDGRLMIDGASTFGAKPFPSWMDVAAAQKETFRPQGS